MPFQRLKDDSDDEYVPPTPKRRRREHKSGSESTSTSDGVHTSPMAALGRVMSSLGSNTPTAFAESRQPPCTTTGSQSSVHRFSAPEKHQQSRYVCRQHTSNPCPSSCLNTISNTRERSQKPLDGVAAVTGCTQATEAESVGDDFKDLDDDWFESTPAPLGINERTTSCRCAAPAHIGPYASIPSISGAHPPGVRIAQPQKITKETLRSLLASPKERKKERWTKGVYLLQLNANLEGVPRLTYKKDNQCLRLCPGNQEKEEKKRPGASALRTCKICAARARKKKGETTPTPYRMGAREGHKRLRLRAQLRKGARRVCWPNGIRKKIERSPPSRTYDGVSAPEEDRGTEIKQKKKCEGQGNHDLGAGLVEESGGDRKPAPTKLRSMLPTSTRKRTTNTPSRRYTVTAAAVRTVGDEVRRETSRYCASGADMRLQ
ncbi:hypothetical protein C8R47DRAFT_1201508 [Mycena vitilis]|nr:hypothetical protein C8R47DRAFT_1201508 [Mycena vitilis]